MTQAPSRFPHHTYCIRVAHGRGNLPYAVQLILPRADGLPSTSVREPNKIYLEDLMPNSIEHHTLLGQFLHHWTGVEFALAHLLSKLVSGDEGALVPITRNMGIKQIIDAIISISTRKLNDQGISNIENILERVSKINSKRNILVHGYWTMEVVVFPAKGRVAAKIQLLREIAPLDKRIEPLINDLRNQKERIRHTFTTKRILGATFDALHIT